MLNFQTLFESIPGLYLVYSLDFVIVGGSDAYFQATKTKREEVVGRFLFDVFPDNPDDPNANGVQNLLASLESVLKHRKPHTMAVQKYDIRRPESEGGGFEERYWTPINSPVFDENGVMTHIIHRAEDVTEFVRVHSGATSQLSIPNSQFSPAARELLAQVETNLKLAQLRREATQREQTILEGFTDAFMALDLDFRFTYANVAAQRVSQTPLEALLGKTMWKSFPATIGTQFEFQYRRALIEQVAVEFEEYYAPLDLWVEVHVYPSPTGLSLFFRDINDRKQSEAALQQVSAELERQVRKFDAIASSVPDFIYTFDLSGRFTYINQPLLDLWQKTSDQALGKNFFDLDYPTDVATRLQTQIQQVIETRQPLKDETPYKSAFGTRAYEYIFVPLFSANGAVEAVAGVTRDITDRQQSEAELRESEQRYRTLFETINQGFCVCEMLLDENGKPTDYRFLELNPLFEAMTGLEQALGKTARELVPNLEAQWFEIYGRVALTGEPVRFENHAEAMNRWFEVSAFRVGEPQNHKFAILFTNITDRKQAEMSLRESEERFRSMADNAPFMVWVTDSTGYCTYLSQSWYDFTGQTEKLGLGFGWLNATHPDDRQYAERTFLEANERNAAFRLEYRLRRQDGKYIWAIDAANPWFGLDGQYKGYIGSVIDITERKQAEADRDRLLQSEQAARAISEAARSAAETANRIKDEFLAVLSHELRSPLNPILGWSKLLQQGKLDATKTKIALATIERNAQLQVQLIDALLDISRILRGKLSLRIVPVDLGIVIAAALETVRLAAEAKSIQIQTMSAERNSQGTAVGIVNGDAGRLQQVAWNLLSNAIKFTPEGGQVSVDLAQIGTQAQIQVRDTGKGISPDFLPYVFEYFRQEDSATTRKFGGLGLGLAIVRQIVEMHGGTVAVDSPGEGQGATFTVRIPLAAGSIELPSPERSSSSTSDLSGIHILVVEDDTDSREFLTFVLEQTNAIVTTVASGIDALQAIARLIPDVIVSDIGMPDMDGYMLMRQIRTWSPEQGGRIPAVALTAYAAEFDQQQALAAGFQQHVAKPVEPDALVKAITTLIESHK